MSDPKEIERRLEIFLPRIGFYYENWDTLVARWQSEVDRRIEELTALDVPRLPELEDEQQVIHDHALGSNYRLMAAYDRAIHLYNELNQLHFELLLLAYGAYLTFFQFCQAAFPDMGLQVMAQMIAGYDTTMMRPDDELKKSAAKAIELGIDGAFREGRSPEEILAELGGTDHGRTWIDDLEARKQPWLGQFVAELQVPDRGVLEVARSGFRAGHYTLWAPPDVLLACVVAIVPLLEARKRS